MRLSARLALAFTLLFGGGCASTCPANASAPCPPREAMLLRTPGNLEQATIDGARIFGPNFEIGRFTDGYRGRAFDGLVDLRVSGDVIEGTLRGRRTELHLEETADGFSLRGINAGRLASLDVRESRIAGQVGRCGYELDRVDGEGAVYGGRRACPRMESAELALPARIAALPAPDRAALLAIFLSQ